MDISFLKEMLSGISLPNPKPGKVPAGHEAGEPFDKYVEDLLKEKSKNVYRQYEYLNNLYKNNLECTTLKSRYQLIDKKSLRELFKRGKETTKAWKITNKFIEKQDDTADILIEEDGFFQILDVKTRNLAKKAQKPNIISALKLAEVCKIMLETNEFNAFNIIYISIEWELIEDKMVCKNAYIKELFKCPPENLYINWTAGRQIQEYIDDTLNQSYEGNMKEWAIQYLRHYVEKGLTFYTKQIKSIKEFDLTK